MSLDYVREYYKVPAEIGRRVIVAGKEGVIVGGVGPYVNVLFDKDNPGSAGPCHPMWKVEYLDIGPVRKPSKGRARYLKYLEFSDCFDSFRDFLRSDLAKA